LAGGITLKRKKVLVLLPKNNFLLSGKFISIRVSYGVENYASACLHPLNDISISRTTGWRFTLSYLLKER
jgi:hypothetical protein